MHWWSVLSKKVVSLTCNWFFSVFFPLFLLDARYLWYYYVLFGYSLFFRFLVKFIMGSVIVKSAFLMLFFRFEGWSGSVIRLHSLSLSASVMMVVVLVWWRWRRWSPDSGPPRHQKNFTDTSFARFSRWVGQTQSNETGGEGASRERRATHARHHHFIIMLLEPGNSHLDCRH